MIPQVVYADDWLLVVDKPAGQPTQATADGRPGLFDALRAQHPYVGLHHRLDTAASGLVLFTRDTAANPAIAMGFAQHTIARTYRAVLVGQPRAAVWDRPVDKRDARTNVQVDARQAGLCAVTLRLETGRKHQLRVHAALAGCPIAGDRRYGGASVRRWPRLALHAAQLSLAHPITGEPLVLDAPIPADLASLFAEAGC